MLAHSLTESDGAGDSPDAGFVDAGAVLVIDDSATSRGVVATALRSLGYAVTEAASGRAGLEEALRGSFELILLDIDMPDLNGHAVLLGVRDKYSESECPVIVFIRSDSDEEVLRSLRGGASDCIRKPLNMASLIARVRTQLRRTRAEAELRDARQALEAQVSTRTAKLIRSNELLLNQVSEQRAAEADLQRSEERYRALFAQNPAMFYTVERDGLISSTNGFGARQLGYAETEIVGRPLSVLYLDSEWPSIEAYIGTCWENPAGVGRWETRVIKRDGSTLWVRTTGRVVDYGQTQQLLLVSEDITEAHNLSELLTYQASHDPLTGLVNRREFEK
nr:response regulator [Gammaproteobacteria bacterium]